MRLTVHDVGLGQFISLIHENDHTMFWDAGTKEGFTPTLFCKQMGIYTVDRLFITNFDQDHLSGLPELVRNVEIRSIWRNNLAPADLIHSIKRESGPVTNAMTTAIEMHRTWTHPVAPDLLVLPPDVSIQVFRNTPSSLVCDTNNLSLVTVLTCRGVKFVISGDLERLGWDALISSTDILDHIKGTHVFVASHHGRENGYHEGVMEIASPRCVVMSDYEVRHATQESLGLYRRHCSGVEFGGVTRHILTTRSDGSFWWDL